MYWEIEWLIGYTSLNEDKHKYVLMCPRFVYDLWYDLAWTVDHQVLFRSYTASVGVER